MLRLAVLVLMAMLVAGVQPSSAQRPALPPQAPCDPGVRTTDNDDVLVGRLNTGIQQRFASFDEFGMRRIVSPYQHDPLRLEFGAENESERQLVCELTSRGADVALLIAGRGLLGYRGEAPTEPRLLPAGNNATLSLPVRICGEVAPADLPSRTLLEGAAKDAFESGRASATSGGWTISAFAVPATSEACVNCHNGMNKASTPHPMLFPDAPRLEVGDTIGVAVFASRTGRLAGASARRP